MTARRYLEDVGQTIYRVPVDRTPKESLEGAAASASEDDRGHEER